MIQTELSDIKSTRKITTTRGQCDSRSVKCSPLYVYIFVF